MSAPASPFHAGESRVQARVGVADKMAALGPHVIRDYLVDQHEAGDPGNVEFRVSGVFELAEPEGSFDMVLALSLLHLVSDRAALLGRVHTLLKSGGQLITSTICLTGAWQLLRPLFALGARAGRLPPIQFLSEARHERELREQAFTVVDRLPSPKASSGLFLVSRRD